MPNPSYLKLHPTEVSELRRLNRRQDQETRVCEKKVQTYFRVQYPVEESFE